MNETNNNYCNVPLRQCTDVVAYYSINIAQNTKIRHQILTALLLWVNTKGYVSKQHLQAAHVRESRRI